MLHITADVSITRRKRYHMIENEKGEILFRAKLWSQILDWLDSENIEVYTVVTERASWLCSGQRQSPLKDYS